MTAAPTIAVIIVNYNSGAWLQRCVTALAQQTFADFEAIILDNASSDGSFSLAETPPDGRFRFIGGATNLGFAAGNNLAIAATTAPWIATLNPDAIPEPGWLAALLDATRRYPQIDMFGSTQIDASDPERLDGAGDVYNALGFSLRGGYGHPLSTLPGEGETFAPCAAAALYRRSALLAAGGFDERYFCYVEDVDLAFRMRLAGARCIQLNTAIVHHAGGVSSAADRSFSLYHGTRNTLWTFVKNMPGALFWLLLPGHLALHIYLMLMYRPASLRPVVRRAFRDAIAGLGPILRTRRTVQAGRRISLSTLARDLCWSLRAIRRRTPVRLR